MAEAQTTPPAPSPQPQQQPMATAQVDEKTWALFAHLSTLTYVLGGGVLTFLGPLIVWLVGKDKAPSIDAHGKEALNFGITISIIALVGWVTTFILIGFAILLAAFVLWLIFMIMAVMAANKGEMYRYPLTFRFIS